MSNLYTLDVTPSTQESEDNVSALMGFEKEVIGNATLYRGDCVGVVSALNVFDVMITDPPYGIELGGTSGTGGEHGLNLEAYDDYIDTYESYLTSVVPVITEGVKRADRSAVFVGPHIHEMPKFDALGGVYCSAASARHQWGFKNFLPVMLYGKYPDLQKGAKIPTVLASNETTEKNGHPCPKPIGWMKWLVRLATREGEVVFDPFMGSGTTGVAALQEGRKFIGCEISPKYFDIACKRIEEAQKQLRLFT